VGRVATAVGVIMLLVACSSSSSHTARPASSTPSPQYAACDGFWQAIRTPSDSGRANGVAAAARSAEEAHDSGFASLIRYSFAPGRFMLNRTDAVLAYCHHHGWPFGTRDHPVCQRLSEWAAADGGVAAFERRMRAQETYAVNHAEANWYTAYVVAVATRCGGQAAP
jgi:hypothetical protein